MTPVRGIGFIVPRYGEAVIGGAELGVRLLAEHLVALGAAEVEVFTTCALDATTWNDELAPGSSVERGVTVHRFRSLSGRHRGFDARSDRVLRRSGDTPLSVARAWVEDQGPVCPDLVDAASASRCEVVSLSPYLYHPIVTGVARLGRRAVLHAAAHDEAPLRLAVYDALFETAGGLVFYTHGERLLVERRFPAVVHHPQIVLGLGSDVGEGDPESARVLTGVGDRPYLVCVGRVDRGKGTDTLAAFFKVYKQRHPGPLALVFVGPVVHRPEPGDDVIVTDRVDESTKWGLLRGAEVLVSPSGYESFSFVTLEAWSARTPVMVNARCEATREHCERSGGGFWFDDYATFEVALDRLLADRALRHAMAAAGCAYVEANFRWPTVVDRYVRFVDSLAIEPAKRSGAGETDTGKFS